MKVAWSSPTLPWREVPAAVLITVLAILGCCAAVAAGADPYYVAERQAVKEGKWLVVFQGTDAIASWDDRVLTCTGNLKGYPPACAIILRPRDDGYLHRVALLENPTPETVKKSVAAAMQIAAGGTYEEKRAQAAREKKFLVTWVGSYYPVQLGDELVATAKEVPGYPARCVIISGPWPGYGNAWYATLEGDVTLYRLEAAFAAAKLAYDQATAPKPPAITIQQALPARFFQPSGQPCLT